MKNYEHEFYVTRKCTKMEYFTVRANSMEEAKEEAENGNEYFDFNFGNSIQKSLKDSLDYYLKHVKNSEKFDLFHYETSIYSNKLILSLQS